MMKKGPEQLSSPEKPPIDMGVIDVEDASKLERLGGGVKDIVEVEEQTEVKQTSGEDGGYIPISKKQSDDDTIPPLVVDDQEDDDLRNKINRYMQEGMRLPNAIRNRVFGAVLTLGKSEELRKMTLVQKIWNTIIWPVFKTTFKILSLGLYKGPEERFNLRLAHELNEQMRKIIQGESTSI